MKFFRYLLVAALAAPAGVHAGERSSAGWRVDFCDDFDTFDAGNRQDQLLWVNDEDQCCVRMA